MQEVLLHFIWEFRYFNHRELTTESGDPVHIHHPGDRNTNQGPDFLNARITIGDTLLEGPVELHVRASDWSRHGHTGDPHYGKVILHVVWENDSADAPGGIPVVVLHHRTSTLLLSSYRQFMTNQTFVPCERLLPAATQRAATRQSAIPRAATQQSANPRAATKQPALPWPAFRKTLLLQRLRGRTAFIRTLVDEHNPYWEEVTWWLIARSLGQPVNPDAFLAIARSIPLNRLLRRRADPAHLESLLIAEAARLDPPLSFHRMRPAHSPLRRLRQLAVILSNHSGWFTLLLESDHPAAFLKTLDAGGLGTSTKHSILINAGIPLLSAYSTLRQEPRQHEKATRWLYETPPENNSIIRRWRELGMPAHTAADTQALLELKKNFCAPKKCLDCAIGRALLADPSPAAPSPTRPSPANGNPA
ncbi:MAG TPA: DUF2851 family protein [Puia sp.]|nr:DUF2851 family protein [Puia sp.]